MSFELKPLSSLIELQRGHDLPSRERTEGTVPIIGSFGVTGWHNVERYAGPGVAIGRSGASIGRATYVDGAYWPLNTCLFVRDFKGNDPRWVYWMLHNLDFAAYNSGSAQPSLNRNYLSQILVGTPSLHLQGMIGEMLGALDDKIFANRTVVASGLEYLDSVFARSAHLAGTVEVASIAQTVLGGTPARDNLSLWGGSVPWLNSGACNSRIIFKPSEKITELGLAKSAAKLLPAGATCVAITGATLGQMGWLASPMAANQSVVGVVAEPEDRLWIHLAMRSEREQLIGWATGGAQQHVNKNSVASLSLPYESERAVRFETENGAVMRRVVQAEIENEQLAAARDELVPLLMSGKIAVKEAEKTVEEVV
ncbi:restriction endonuclease subunit S [Brachybacterium tyrofermentans]|uniref:restriction endonuclease subunit S n=1 Tax=Brachybacterium tyrofermentans TaxID=47848 RepID=UPI003FD1C7ED